MTDTDYRLWYEEYVTPIVGGFALTFLAWLSHAYFSTSDGEIIFEVSHPGNLIRKFMHLLGITVAAYFMLKVASKRLRFLSKAGIPVVALGVLSVAITLYSYATATIRLKSGDYTEISGPLKVTNLGYGLLNFYVNEEHFQVIRNDFRDFAGEADWKHLQKFSEVKVRYDNAHKILAIYGIRDNKPLEPTSNPAGAGFSAAQGRRYIA